MKALEIIEREMGAKSHRVVYSDFSKINSNNNTLQPNSDELRNSYALNDAQINELIEVGLKIENIFGRPQDIEAINYKGEWYIVQTRAITKSPGGKNGK